MGTTVTRVTVTVACVTPPYAGVKYTPGDVVPGARYTVYGGRVNGSKGSHVGPRTALLLYHRIMLRVIVFPS